jgi:hypothetical protein
MPIRIQDVLKQLTALMCSLLLVASGSPLAAQAQEPKQTAATEEQAPKIPNDQLDSLVAPIALYQDELLAQVLMASTYPLEIVQLQQFLAKHKDLKDKALADAVMKQNWDPSIQAMAALPDVVKRLSEDIKWTTDLGNAVLAQQSDVMDAVQRMRAKAAEKGNLKSNEQIKVETKVVENKTVIVVQQSKPDVVYVPSYDPVVVYGAPPYPYPPIAYPPPGYYAAGMAISFGVGMAMGAAWGGGGWCCNSGWGGNNDITINNNNSYVNNSNRQNVSNSGNRTGNRTGGSNNWQHNPQHRGGTPYSNKSTANKFGGQTGGRQNQAGGRNQAGTTDRGGRQQAGSMDRGGGGSQAGTMDRGGSGGRQQAGSMDRGAGGADRGGGGGGDRVGNRSVSSGSGSSSSGGGFSGGGSSGRSSGSSARASSSRGSSSMGGSRGGGRRR